MNNLQLFRSEVNSQLQNGAIENAEQMNTLLDALCDAKILSVKEVHFLKQHSAKREFPITAPQFEEILSTL